MTKRIRKTQVIKMINEYNDRVAINRYNKYYNLSRIEGKWYVWPGYFEIPKQWKGWDARFVGNTLAEVQRHMETLMTVICEWCEGIGRRGIDVVCTRDYLPTSSPRKGEAWFHKRCHDEYVAEELSFSVKALHFDNETK